MPNIAIIPYGSVRYASMKRFREMVLRIPIGLQLTDKDIEGEEYQTHIAALDASDRIMGTVLLKPLSPDLIKLRQMAVDPALHGTGLGRKLVCFAEQTAREKGCRFIELHARISALGFYKKLGYASEGEPFEEVTLPTIRMVKHVL